MRANVLSDGHYKYDDTIFTQLERKEKKLKNLDDVWTREIS
jgi:hypothetical protein